MHCVFINVDFVPGTEEEIYDREAWAVFAVFIKVSALTVYQVDGRTIYTGLFESLLLCP